MKNFTERVFREPIALQRRIEKEGKTAGEQWANWPQLKPLLSEVLKEPSTNSSRDAQLKNYQKINRLLLEAQYPDEIYKQDTVRRPVVVDWDQVFRLVCIALLTAIAILVMTRIRLNVTSLHWYYRDQCGGLPRGELSRRDPASQGGPAEHCGYGQQGGAVPPDQCDPQRPELPRPGSPLHPSKAAYMRGRIQPAAIPRGL